MRRIGIISVSLLVIYFLFSLNLYAETSLVLWNTLGSDEEILNSKVGPGLEFYDQSVHGGTGIADETGRRVYVPDVRKGNGKGVQLVGNYYITARIHNIILSNLDTLISPERGKIEVWYTQYADPVSYDHNVYRIFDGPYGFGPGIALYSEVNPADPSDVALRFALAFGGTNVEINFPISQYNGKWIEIAAVWDRTGIGGTSKTMRLDVNNVPVAFTTENDWGTTVGDKADICGANDAAGYFAIGSLKIYD